jgi:hypothetical protein
MAINPFLTVAKCPEDWAALGIPPDLATWLNFLWYSECHSRQIDREASHIFLNESFLVEEELSPLLEGDDEEVNRYLANLGGWIGKARDEYIEFTRRFSLLSAVGRAEYKKHYPQQAMTLEAARTASLARNASVLRSELTPELQEHFMWEALDHVVYRHMAEKHYTEVFEDPAAGRSRLLSLLDTHNLKISANFCHHIGASAGDLTPYGRIDIDFSTPQFHIYPIGKEEYDRAALKAHVQPWNHTSTM